MGRKIRIGLYVGLIVLVSLHNNTSNYIYQSKDYGRLWSQQSVKIPVSHLSEDTGDKRAQILHKPMDVS